MPSPEPKSADRSLPQQSYPHIEGLIERAKPEDVEAFFAPLRAGLDGLKGPPAEQGKKVRAALERAEELLKHLLDVRGRLEAKPKGSK